MSYSAERDDLIIKYLPLVKRVASRIEINDHCLEQDDLVNIGVIGLIDAINKFDPSKKVPFEAYASLRIKGTIIDELRKSGRVSRDKINKLNKYYKAKENLEKKLRRTPEEWEICKELNIGKKQLFQLHETVHYLSNISLESVIYSDESSDILLIETIKDKKNALPEENLIIEEKKKLLAETIGELKEREKVILNLYYVEELSLKEIAYILDISIPRVSQIHGKILIKLREMLSSKMEDE